MDVKTLENFKMGLNRKNFVEQILNIDFKGNLTSCSNALDIKRGYLYNLLFNEQNAGRSALEKIYKYCRKTKRDPEIYIFTKK
jgi:hypothetical protein